MEPRVLLYDANVERKEKGNDFHTPSMIIAHPVLSCSAFFFIKRQERICNYQKGDAEIISQKLIVL